MNHEVLRSVKGGYDKNAVVDKLENYGILMNMAEAPDADATKIRAELDKLRQTLLPRVKGGLFGKIGFSVEDTDNYFSQLEEKIISAVMQR